MVHDVNVLRKTVKVIQVVDMTCHWIRLNSNAHFSERIQNTKGIKQEKLKAKSFRIHSEKKCPLMDITVYVKKEKRDWMDENKTKGWCT